MNVIIMSNDIFARNGVKYLITEIDVDMIDVVDVSPGEDIFWGMIRNDRVNVIILIECNSDMSGLSGYEFMRKMKEQCPHFLLGMGESRNLSSLHNNHIDFHFYLSDSLAMWRKRLSQFFRRGRGGRVCRKIKFKLSEKEILILYGLKKGLMIGEIANKADMPYGLVSATKNRAMKKLGLNNKNELLLFLIR